MPPRKRDPLAVTYILRVYRCDETTADIAGIVEMPEHGGRNAFRSFDELRTILTDGNKKGRHAGDAQNR